MNCLEYFTYPFKRLSEWISPKPHEDAIIIVKDENLLEFKSHGKNSHPTAIGHLGQTYMVT